VDEIERRDCYEGKKRLK